jgi:hypothetical protein
VGISVGRAPEKIDIRVGRHIGFWMTRANLQDHGRSVTTVLEMVPVRHARFETGAVPGTADLLTAIGDQHKFAFEDPNEFIFSRMPVTLG